MTLENIIIIAVIAILFLYGMALVQFFTFLYYSFKYSDFKQVDRDEVYKGILEILKPSEDFLMAKNFRYIAMLEHGNVIVGNNQKHHIACYYNDKNGVYAFVKTQPYRGALEPVTIVYKTLYVNGKRIETVNGIKHFIQVSPEYVSLYEHYLVDNEAIYLAHLKEIEKEQSSPIKEPFTEENIALFKTQDEKEYIKSWEDAGLIKVNENGYRFRFSLATWKFAKNAVKGHATYAKILRQRKDNSILTKDGESHALIAQLEEMEKPRGKSNKLLWFGISMVAFMVVFGLLGLSFVDIGILIVVLLVHELGHFLAMRYYGYTDTSIFFLPFGAAAVGKKRHKKAYEEYIVFLAGPLPGMIIGAGMLIWSLWQHQSISGENHLIMYAMMSLVINYINLLPIYPLDGGRILQLLLLHRYPKGQFYFYMVSLLLLVIAMVWMQDPVLLIFVVIVALGVKQSYRVSQFMSKLFSKYTSKTIDKTIVVQEMIEDENYTSETLHTKANITKQILHIVQTSKPSKWLVGFGMALYIFLLMPPFAVVYMPSFASSHSEYDKLPKEAQEKLDVFYAKVSSLKGLTQKPKETYLMEESMITLEKYLYAKDVNRTIGKPLVFSEETNLSDVPKALQKMYTWHDGITQLLPDREFFSLEKMRDNHRDILEDAREYKDKNFTTPYRIFISNYSYSGLAYHLKKEGIYDYSMYGSASRIVKRYYSLNHLLKITSEAYKAGIYYYDYDELTIDDARLSELKKAYLSKEDKVRHEVLVHYLQESAIAFRNSPHVYVKKEILRALSKTYESSMIPFIEPYLSDKNKKVRQQAVHSLGVLGDRCVIPLLIRQLDNVPLHCKGCALSGLSYVVNKSDVALLDKIYPVLTDSTVWIRKNAYRVIGRISNVSSLSILKERFNEEHPACKLAMVEAFGRIGDKEVLPLLKRYLKEIEGMDFSVSYEGRSRSKNPHPETLKYEVEKAIGVLSK